MQGSYAGGITTGTPSIAGGIYQTITNAPSIDKLEGFGCQIGGAIQVPIYEIPLMFGIDINLFPDTDTGKMYFGFTRTAGFGTPGGEFHIEWGNTGTLEKTRVNLFDFLRGLL